MKRVLVLAIAALMLSSGDVASECFGQCGLPKDHDELSDCYDGCDWSLAGDLVFCQVVSPDVGSRTVCQSLAHGKWSGCYRQCLN